MPQVRKIRLEKRINEIVNRLNKTKVEGHPNLRQEREDRDKLERNEAKKELKDKQQKEKEELEKRKKELELKYVTHYICLWFLFNVIRILLLMHYWSWS